MAGCSAAGQPAQAANDFEEYVALGDSYSAGGVIANTEATTGCFRSDHNYATLLTQRIRVGTFKDVTCGAADTEAVTHSQTTIAGPVVPPQLDAVTAGTDLVTVGIGGNDFDFFERFAYGEPGVTTREVRQTARRVAGALRAVRAKAPGATIVYVGYPRLVDPGTSCPKRAPFSAAHLRAAYAVQQRLERVLKRAVEATGTLYVDLFTASAGHGICSETPWINGPENLLGVAAPYHPFLAEQQAAAALIEHALSDR